MAHVASLSEQEVLTDIWEHLVTSLHNIHKQKKKNKTAPYHDIKLPLVRMVLYEGKHGVTHHHE